MRPMVGVAAVEDAAAPGLDAVPSLGRADALEELAHVLVGGDGAHLVPDLAVVHVEAEQLVLVADDQLDAPELVAEAQDEVGQPFALAALSSWYKECGSSTSTTTPGALAAVLEVELAEVPLLHPPVAQQPLDVLDLVGWNDDQATTLLRWLRSDEAEEWMPCTPAA